MHVEMNKTRRMTMPTLEEGMKTAMLFLDGGHLEGRSRGILWRGGGRLIVRLDVRTVKGGRSEGSMFGTEGGVEKVKA